MPTVATDALLEEIQELIRERERDGVAGLAERVGPSEWAALVPRLDPSEVAVLLQWLPDEEIPQLLEELDPHAAAAILRTLSRQEAATLLAGMDPDDAADVVENLTEPEISQILVRMDPAEAEEIRRLSDFKPDSAGGIMTPEFVAVTADATADSAIAAIRGLVGSAETVDYVYVVDAERHLIGVLSLYRLMLSPGMTPVTELIAPTTVRVRASAEDHCARSTLLRKWMRSSTP